MTFSRDPLSKRYDGAAGRLVGQALAAPGSWVYANVAPPRPGSWIAGFLAELGIGPGAADAGGLTATERAFQRAVYWTLKGGPGGPNEVWSLQREWGPRTRYGRQLGVRASPRDVAERAIRRKPPAERYVLNESLRSGAAESGQQRF